MVGLALGAGAWVAFGMATTDLAPAFAPTDTIALLVPAADQSTRSMLSLSRVPSTPVDSDPPGFGLGTGVTLNRPAGPEDRAAWVVAEGPEAIRAVRECQDKLGVRESEPPPAVKKLWQWGGSEFGASRASELRTAVYFSTQASTGSAIEESACLLPTASAYARSADGWTLQTPRLITVWGGDWADASGKQPFGCVELEIPAVEAGVRRDYLSPDDFTERARASSGDPDYLQMCGDPSVSGVGARTVLPAVAARYFQIASESAATSLVFVAGALFSLGLGLLVDVGNKLLNQWVDTDLKAPAPQPVGEPPRDRLEPEADYSI